MIQVTTRIKLLQGLIMALLMLPFVLLSVYVGHKHAWAQSKLGEIEPRYARLVGVKDLLPALQKATEQSGAIIAKTAYPAAVDISRAGNDAQQRIRSVFEASKLAIVSIQVLDPKDEDGFERIRVALQAEGVLANFQEAMIRVKDQSPLLMVESFTLLSNGQVRPASVQNLVGNFEFFVLRSKI
jgi:general secretion pathway protein M